MLIVTTTSTEADWVDQTLLEAEIGEALSDADRVVLPALMRRASRWAETVVGHPFGVAKIEETLPGFGRRRMLLSRYPIRAVTGVFDGTDTGSATELTTEVMIENDEAGILARDQGFGWTPTVMPVMFTSAFPLGITPMPGEERRPFLVRYLAGWTMGGIESTSLLYSTMGGTTSTGRTLPEDIEHAVTLRTIRAFQGREDVNKETLGDFSVDYAVGSVDVPDPATELLLPYRKVK